MEDHQIIAYLTRFVPNDLKKLLEAKEEKRLAENLYDDEAGENLGIPGNLPVAPIHAEQNVGDNQEGIQEREQPHDNPHNLRDRRLLRQTDRYEAKFSEYHEPASYPEAITDEHSETWKKAIKEELEALQKNVMRDIVSLPTGHPAISIGSKWTFK